MRHASAGEAPQELNFALHDSVALWAGTSRRPSQHEFPRSQAETQQNVLGAAGKQARVLDRARSESALSHPFSETLQVYGVDVAISVGELWRKEAVLF